jgi:hypothetical protein
MIIKPGIVNLVSIGLMAFIGVWVINRGLAAAGLGHLCATPREEM